MIAIYYCRCDKHEGVHTHQRFLSLVHLVESHVPAHLKIDTAM